METDKTTDNVLMLQWGVMFMRDIHNTDGSIWHRRDEVIEYHNKSTAIANLVINRKSGFPVRLVMRRVVVTPWEIKG